MHVFKRLALGIVGLILIGGWVISSYRVANKTASEKSPDGSAGEQQNGGEAATAIAITSQGFSKEVVTVKKGIAVIWTNEDTDGHTVTLEAEGVEGPSSLILDQGTTYVYVFTEPGEYAYYCRRHPEMKGKIIVEP